MSNELELRYLINLAGNIDQRTNQYARSFASMEQRTTNSARNMQRSLRQLSDGIDRLGNRYTALATGAAGLGTARALADLERRFTRLGIQANRSAEDMDVLKKKIFDVAADPDIAVGINPIIDAMDAILEKTGDFDFFEKNMRNIAVAIGATGAEGKAIGEIAAEIQKWGVIDPSKVMEVFDILNNQGKEGAFTLQDIAALGPRVMTAYGSAVKGGRDAATVAREMGAALQTIRAGTGSSEQAATAFERLLSDLQDVNKLKQLSRLGIQVFDPNQPGAEVMRPINELMLEIMEKTKGRRTILGQIFGDEAVRAFNSIDPEKMKKFMNVSGDGSATFEDAKRAAKDAAGAMDLLRTGWMQFADKNLTEPIKNLAQFLHDLEPGTLQQAFEWLKKIAIVVGSIWAVNKVARIGSSVIDFGKGVANAYRGYKTGGFAGALGSMSTGGATPVYVTNMPADGLNSTTGVNDALGYKNGKKAWDKIRDFEMPGVRGGAGMKDIWRMGPKGLAIASGYVGAAGLVGYGVGTGIYKYGMEGNRGGDAVGAGVARVLALFGNDEAQASIARMRKYDEQQQREGLLRIKIDSEGRASVKEMQSPTGTELDVGHTKGMM